MLKTLTDLHHSQFGNSNNLRNFFAPGRVNLIGEHTDYNGGHVFPCALDIGTYAVVSTRQDRKVSLYSSNFPETGVITFNLDLPLVKDQSGIWANYPKGMFKIFLDNNCSIPHGLNIVIGGNIPNGAGLSSSASIEMLMATILNNIYNCNVSKLDLVKWGQKVENNFIGVNCGIMDQFASMMGCDNNAILLNCNNLDYKYAPLNLIGHSIIIANTNKKRGLADSKYNERVRECQTALKELQEALPISSLGDITPEIFMQHEHLISDTINKIRALHAVTENARTLYAVSALNNNDLIQFGQLMNQSHISLRDNYAVTGHELDGLVEAAWQQKSCIGSRMTGAGFGGCTVSIVEKPSVDDFIKKVGDLYFKKTGLQADFYVANISDGARELSA